MSNSTSENDKKIKMKLCKGDKINVLDEDIDGVISEIKGNKIYVVTNFGIEMQFEKSEVVKIGNELKNIAHQNIHKALQEKTEPKKINLTKKKKEIEREIAFDLHIENLVVSTKGMQPFDMLELQIETVRKHIDFAIKKRIPKIVLIHGVGQGRLRSEIEYLLRRYENIWFKDANFRNYGQGAIEINFRQNARRTNG